MTNAERAGFLAYMRLSEIESDAERNLGLVSRALEEVEEFLLSRGIGLDGPEFEKSITSVDRATARDAAIETFNKENPGTRLPFTSDVVRGVREIQLEDLFQRYDFSDPGFLSKFVARPAGFLAQGVLEGTIGSLVRHPTGSIPRAVIATALLSTGPTGPISSLLYRTSVSGLWFASSQIPVEEARKQLQELQGQVPEDQIRAFAENFARDSAVSLGFVGLGIGLKAGLKGVRLLREGRKASDNLRTRLRGAYSELSTSERADFYAKTKETMPGSAMSYGEKTANDRKVSEFVSAYTGDETNIAEDLLQTPSPAIKPGVSTELFDPDGVLKPGDTKILEKITEPGAAPVPGEEGLLFPNGKKNQGQKWSKILQEENNVTRSTGNLDTNVGEAAGRGPGAAEIPKELADRLLEDTGRRTPRELYDTARDATGATGDVRYLVSTVEQAFPNATAESAALGSTWGSLRKNLEKLYTSDLETYPDLAEIVLGETPSTGLLLDIKRRDPQAFESTLGVIKDIRRLRAKETILQINNASKPSVGSFFLDGHSSLLNVQTGLNTIIQRRQFEVARLRNNLYKDIRAAAERALKTKRVDLRRINLERVADHLIQNQDGSGKLEAVVAGAIREFQTRRRDMLFRDGVDASNILPNGLPNAFSPSKVSKVPRDFFVSEMMRSVDIRQMKRIAAGRGRPIEDPERFFRQMYKNISLNRQKRTITTATEQTVFSGDRIVVFKDGESWKRAHDLFGTIKTFPELLNIINKRATKHLEVSALGIESAQEARNFTRLLFSAIREAENKRIGSLPEKQRETLIRNLERIEQRFADYFSLKFQPIIGMHPVAEFIGEKLIGSWLRAGTSGSAITTLATDGFGGTATLQAAVGADNSILPYLRRIIFGASKQELEELVAVSSMMNNKIADSIENGRIINSLKGVISLPGMLQEAASDFTESGAQALYMARLHTLGNKTFTELPDRLRSFFSRQGIKPRDWEDFRKLPSFEVTSGGFLKSAAYAEQASNAAPALIDKFARAEIAASAIGAPIKTPLGTTMKVVNPGTSDITRILSRTIEPFSNITYSSWLSMMPVVTELWKTDKVDFTKVLTMQLFGGFVTVMAKAALRGRKVDLTDYRTYLQAVLYSGMLGSTADIAADVAIGYGGFSPRETAEIGLRKFATGKPSEITGALDLWARSVNPYANLGITGELMNRYILDATLNLFDPSVSEEYNKRLERQLDADRITEWRYDMLKFR